MLLPVPFAVQRRRRRVPLATLLLIGANVGVFLALALPGAESVQEATNLLGLRSSSGVWYSLVTAMFIHANVGHLAINVLYLWLFGSIIEDALGVGVLLLFYLGSQMAAGVVHILGVEFFLPEAVAVPMVGASGAIYGLLGLATVRFMRTPVRVASIFFPRSYWLGSVPLWVLAMLYVGWNIALLLWVLMARSWGKPVEAEGMTAYWAHLGGFFFGLVGAWALRFKEQGDREYLLQDARRPRRGPPDPRVVARLAAMAEADPSDPEVHDALGRLWERAGLWPKARAAYEQAIGQYVSRGDRRNAVAAYRAIRRLFDRYELPPRLEFSIACALDEAGASHEAREAYRAVARRGGGSGDAENALLRLGLLSQAMGDREAACAAFTELLERFPLTPWRRLVTEHLEGPGKTASEP